jgi:transcriptional regulator with XRE-family HTH domain
MGTSRTENVLRQLREANGSSLRAAAQDLGLDPSHLSRVERGEKKPSPDVSERMARYYGVSPDLLALMEGRVPSDVLEILVHHPEVLDKIRREYA